jgi:putative SOS response-associated peptidase YedK
MCSHYEAPSPAALAEAFGVEPYEQLKLNLWPGYFGPFLRAAPHDGESEGSTTDFVVESGSFGLIPGWSKDAKIARRTYNARSETVASKPSYRNAWRNGQHCIIPAAAIYEPDWRSGKAVPTRIERVDGVMMGIAGLWERWKNPDGEVVFSYTMLTVNADDHAFMRDFHKVDDEKRMVVILPKGSYRDWLHAVPGESIEFMRQYPADRLLVSNAAEHKAE